MKYSQPPKMILFDVGGTLFGGGKFSALNGLSQLRLRAVNPDVTEDETLARLWDEYMAEIGSQWSESGIKLDMPLTSALKYITMNAGLHFDISLAEQEEIFDRYNSERTVNDGIPELLEAMREQGIRMAVISNNAMSGEGLALAIKHWIPTAEPEFVLTSADLLFTKPDKSIFIAAANYAHLDPEDCWYCGDGRAPDVDGSFNSGMVPVFYDKKSPVSSEMRTDGGRGEYLAINHWNELTKIIKSTEC